MNVKKQAGVWIDGKKAIIVSLTDNDPQITEISSSIEDRKHHDKQSDKGSFMGQQHMSHEKTFEERKKHQLSAYLKEVITSLQGVTELYICGPAEMKTHLKKEAECDRELEKTVRGMDACEHMTENQLVAKVKEFFVSS